MALAPRHREVRTRAVSLHEFVLPPHFRVPAHGHQPPHILVMLEGGLRELTGPRPVAHERGSVRYSPPADEHQVVVGSRGARCLVVEAPGFPELTLRKRYAIPPHEAAPIVEGLWAELSGARVLSPARVEEWVLALFTMVRVRSNPAWRGNWVDDVKALVDAGSARLQHAADTVGRSRGLVARRFRALYGVSIQRHLRRRQLDRAWNLLTDGARPLSEVALDAGFTDQSHLTRVMSREVGCTPAALRRVFTDHGSVAANYYLAAPLRVIGA